MFVNPIWGLLVANGCNLWFSLWAHCIVRKLLQSMRGGKYGASASLRLGGCRVGDFVCAHGPRRHSRFEVFWGHLQGNLTSIILFPSFPPSWNHTCCTCHAMQIFFVQNPRCQVHKPTNGVLVATWAYTKELYSYFCCIHRIVSVRSSNWWRIVVSSLTLASWPNKIWKIFGIQIECECIFFIRVVME